MTSRMWIVGLMAHGLLIHTAAAVEPLSTKELAEHCLHYHDDPEGTDAIFCVRYVQGFIDGAVATDERVTLNVATEYQQDESLTERAFRTRAPNRRLANYGATVYAEFCLGGPVPLKEVVEHVIEDLRQRKVIEEQLLARERRLLRAAPRLPVCRGRHERARLMTISPAQWARLLLFFTLLAGAWLLWSGLFKPLLLGLGAFSCLLVAYLTHRMGRTDHEQFRVNFNLRFLSYWLWLTREIVRSSLEVARVVLNPRLPISPRIVEIEATARHPVDQVTLGNSITLTPGTIALEVRDGVLRVHTLTQEGADELMSGEIDRRIAALRTH